MGGQFFVADGGYLMKAASIARGPVFHHGIKDRVMLQSWYFSSVERCEPNPQVLQDPVKFGDMALNLINQYKELYLEGEVCFQCTDECIRSFSCEPLAFDAEPRPQFSLQPAAKPAKSGGSKSHGFAWAPEKFRPKVGDKS